MFYCAPCATKNGWPDYGARASYGRCEVCGNTAGCNDVPSSCLPIPKRKTVEPKDNPNVTEIAVRLHAAKCNYDHTEACGWYYELTDKGTVHMWTRSSHNRYLQMAVKFIDSIGGYADARRALDGFEAIKGL